MRYFLRTQNAENASELQRGAGADYRELTATFSRPLQLDFGKKKGVGTRGRKGQKKKEGKKGEIGERKG